MTFNSRIPAAVILAATATTASHASVGVIYESNGFEPATFAPGNLVGQDGWGSFATTAATGNATATVHSSGAPIKAGVQAVTIDRPNTDGLGSTGFFVDVTAPAASHQPVVYVQWDMYVPFSGDQDPDPNFESFGPGFALEAYSSGVAPQRLASVGVDSSDGAFYNKLDNGLSQFGDYTSNAAIALDQWQAWELVLDFNTELFFVIVDGTVVTTAGGTPFLSDIDYAGGDRLIDAPVITFPTDEFYFDIVGEAQIDNYRILDGTIVPEPGIALLAGLGGLALLRRRG